MIATVTNKWRKSKHADLTTTIAFEVARLIGVSPLEAARLIVKEINLILREKA